MEFLSTLDVLREHEEKIIQALIAKLNTDGIASDEDNVGLGRVMIDRWSKQCDKYLEARGYCGGTLKTSGKFYDSHGAVYVLFDENKWDYASVGEYLNNHVKNYKY